MKAINPVPTRAGDATISKVQIRLIWVLARQLGLDSDMLHEMVHGITGKESLTQLSVMDGREVIEAMIRAGGKVKKKRKRRGPLPSNVLEMATRQQQWLINHLENKLGWAENPERLKGFMKRIIKKEAVRTKAEAQKIIQGLINFKGQERRKAG